MLDILFCFIDIFALKNYYPFYSRYWFYQIALIWSLFTCQFTKNNSWSFV